MTERPNPKVSRRPALPLIWIVPLVALVIAGWMIARQFRNRGPLVAIEFASASGVEEGKTEVYYKGVSVGTVTRVELSKDFTGTVVTVRLTRPGAALARAGSEFWVVHPEVSLSGVHGLDTLVTGVRLRIRPGRGPPTRHFRGLDEPPPIEATNAGRAFTLRADKLGGLTPGAPVYFRGVKVGAVETTQLSPDATSTLIRIRVYTRYVALVRTNSQFWNAGGIDVKLSLLGANVHAASLESLFTGGVAFATPDQPNVGAEALSGTQFELYEKPDKEWRKWRPRIPINPVESAPNPTKSGHEHPPTLAAPP